MELDYVSVGCNRTPQSVDWYEDHTLAYGAASSVALAEVAEVCMQWINNNGHVTKLTG